MMLQKWFGLSDPGVEMEIYDRLSFREFLGLSVSDKVPDETTLVNFRKRLHQSGQYHKLLEKLNGHLAHKGVKVESGTLIDATFVDMTLPLTQVDQEKHRPRKATQETLLSIFLHFHLRQWQGHICGSSFGKTKKRPKSRPGC